MKEFKSYMESYLMALLILSVALGVVYLIMFFCNQPINNLGRDIIIVFCGAGAISAGDYTTKP